MALRLVALLAMACLCAAQTTDMMMDTTMEATTMEPTTMEPTTMEPTTMEPTTMEPTTMEPTTMEVTTLPPPPGCPPGAPQGVICPPGSIQDQVDAQTDLAERYIFLQAYQFRRQTHFFCPAQGAPFVRDEIANDNERIVHNWSLFLQYPILAYLDSMKKGVLVRQIIGIINDGGFAGITEDNICIGLVEHYDVSLYTESVLINFYLDDTVIGMNDTRIELINSAFREGLGLNDPMFFDLFDNRQAIRISNSTYGQINSNVHPGAFDTNGQRFPESEDPTLRAIVLGYWPREYTLNDFVLDRALNASITMSFATNPNPVFYGLTGGDYVFIVVASVLLTILCFLMIYGFCIQPFFM